MDYLYCNIAARGKKMELLFSFPFFLVSSALYCSTAQCLGLGDHSWPGDDTIDAN